MTLRFGFLTLVISILGFFALVLPASAQSITCANVRCAGHCVETPAGPVCEPQRLSCANTLCAQGNHCIETQSGPECVSTPSQPLQVPPQTPSQTAPQTPWPPWPQNPTPSEPVICPEPWPTPNPRPTPPIKESIACPMIYAPICGEKIVQCFRAPCPPLRQTFSNSCVASAEGYTVLYKGECG